MIWNWRGHCPSQRSVRYPKSQSYCQPISKSRTMPQNLLEIVFLLYSNKNLFPTLKIGFSCHCFALLGMQSQKRPVRHGQPRYDNSSETSLMTLQSSDQDYEFWVLKLAAWQHQYLLVPLKRKPPRWTEEKAVDSGKEWDNWWEYQWIWIWPRKTCVCVRSKLEEVCLPIQFVSATRNYLRGQDTYRYIVYLWHYMAMNLPHL